MKRQASVKLPRKQRGRSWLYVIAALALAGGILSELSSKTDTAAAAVLSDPAAMRSLAKQVQSRDIVMYTTTDCPYCHEAKDWLASKNLEFVECNIETSPKCDSAYKEGRMRGVPTLVVRGTQMSAGFSSTELVALLSKSS